MALILIVISIVGCIILFDFAITGLIPSKIGISPALSDLNLNEILIEEFFSNFKTNIETFKSQGSRIHWKSAILTDEYFLVKLTRLTYKFSVEVDSIIKFEIIKGISGKRIKLTFLKKNEKNYFEFNPRNIDEWIKQLSNIGIEEVKNINPIK